MKKYSVLILIFTIALFVVSPTQKISAQNKDVIQLAILLDTSSSMDGLINQAKSQLWKIVNELAVAKKNGSSPELQVAVFEYGNDSLPASENYIRMAVPLTNDLDKVSEELFKLSTNGGSEYCGTVIDKAVKTLNWSKSNKDLKLIFIAGNEPFNQGGVDFRKSCKSSIGNGIIVNTIFCGYAQTGIASFWKEGADLADGEYMSINQNDRIAYIKAPQDDEIAKLGRKLNKTYLGYGAKGSMKKQRQAAQDKNAASMNDEVAVERMVSKSSKQYNNSSWDIVDAVKNNKVELEKMDKKDLPDEMKKMSKKERKAYVEKLINEREQIQKKIQQLNKQRQKYLTDERKKMSKKNTLDEVILNAVRKQAVDQNYKFKK